MRTDSLYPVVLVFAYTMRPIANHGDRRREFAIKCTYNMM